MFALLLLAFWTEDRGRVRFAAGQEHFTYVLVALVTTTLAFRGWLWLAEDLHLRFPSIPLLAFVLAFPAGAATMYTRVVTRFQTTIGFAFILAIFLGLMWRVDLLLAIYVLIIGLVGSHLVLRCNRRQCVVRAAVVTGVIVAPVAACLGLLDGQPAGGVAWLVAGGAAGAVLSGLVMLSASPVLEGLFGHMTRIRLETCGFVMMSLGRVPQTADHFEWKGHRFEIIDMDGRRVDKVLVTTLPPRPVTHEIPSNNKKPQGIVSGENAFKPNPFESPSGFLCLLRLLCGKNIPVEQLFYTEHHAQQFSSCGHLRFRWDAHVWASGLGTLHRPGG